MTPIYLNYVGSMPIVSGGIVPIRNNEFAQSLSGGANPAFRSYAMDMVFGGPPSPYAQSADDTFAYGDFYVTVAPGGFPWKGQAWKGPMSFYDGSNFTQFQPAGGVIHDLIYNSAGPVVGHFFVKGTGTFVGGVAPDLGYGRAGWTLQTRQAIFLGMIDKGTCWVLIGEQYTDGLGNSFFPQAIAIYTIATGAYAIQMQNCNLTAGGNSLVPLMLDLSNNCLALSQQGAAYTPLVFGPGGNDPTVMLSAMVNYNPVIGGNTFGQDNGWTPNCTSGFSFPRVLGSWNNIDGLGNVLEAKSSTGRIAPYFTVQGQQFSVRLNRFRTTGAPGDTITSQGYFLYGGQVVYAMADARNSNSWDLYMVARKPGIFTSGLMNFARPISPSGAYQA